MLSWVARRKYRTALRHLERGDLDALLAAFRSDCTLTFLGDTALGAELSGRAEIRLWFERFLRLLPDSAFTVQRLQASGLPWRQQIAAHVDIHSTVAGEPYRNQFAHFLTLRWGRVADDLIIEDTQRWANACRRLVGAGVAEAGQGRLVLLRSAPQK